MKKLIYVFGLILLTATINSCAVSKRQTISQPSSSEDLYGSNILLNSYPNVHDRAPIN